MTGISGIMGFQAGGGNLKYQDFLTSGTFNVPAGIEVITAILVGGGGGGGNVTVTSRGGGGGGGGEIVCSSVFVKGISSIPVTIGAGGAGAPSGSDGKGSTGNQTSIGSSPPDYNIAFGGAGGDSERSQRGYYGGYGGNTSPNHSTKLYTTAWSRMLTGGLGAGGGTHIAYPGHVVNIGVAQFAGGGGGGQGYHTSGSITEATDGSNSQFDANSLGVGNIGGGGGASWGSGAPGSLSDSVGGSAAANTGGGGGGGSAQGGGDGGSGFVRIFWTE